MIRSGSRTRSTARNSSAAIPRARSATPRSSATSTKSPKPAARGSSLSRADGKIPPLTPQAQARVAAQSRTGSSFGNGPFNGPEDFSLYDRCITRGFPGSMLPGVYGNSFQIVQGPGLVAIRYEMIHETRVIPLDGRPHAGNGIRLDMGDARGHWEGNTLVVETTNFRQRSVYRNADAGTLRLIERFTRTSPDKDRVVGNGQRPVDLDAPLDLRDPADDERQRADHAVRVSRRESGGEEHPQRREGDGKKLDAPLTRSRPPQFPSRLHARSGKVVCRGVQRVRRRESFVKARRLRARRFRRLPSLPPDVLRHRSIPARYE